MELLTILEPKCSSWGESSGCFDPLTASEVSMAMSGADPIGLMVLQWRIGQKTPSRGFYSLYAMVEGLVVRYQRKMPRRGVERARIRSLMEVCLDDYAQPLKCRVCHGTGQNELYKDCGKCGGTGNRNRSNASRAKQIGIHRSTYMRGWTGKYRIVMNYLLDILPEPEYRAERWIQKRLQQTD